MQRKPRLPSKPVRRIGQAGFTLIEMMVVLVVFVIVVVVATDTFTNIVTRSANLSRREESNIEGIVGLEIFRKDMVQAGFGLPWGFTGVDLPTYSEAASSPAEKFNDSGAAPPIPRAFVAGDNLDAALGVLDQTDYLVLKGAPLALNKAAQKWTYITKGGAPLKWSDGNLETGDHVIVLKREFSEAGYKSNLMHDKGTFYTKFATGSLPAEFSPQLAGETCYVYGISPGDRTPRMPFNRSDYFVKRPDPIPASCADNTGVLYKAVVRHADGGMQLIPILDCVGDMQVVFGWDLAGDDGVVDTYSDASGNNVSGSGPDTEVRSALADAGELRKLLKVVKVYILVQVGGKDPSYRNTQEIVVGNAEEGSLTKIYDVAKIESNHWTNYRWKVYRIVVPTKNLMAQ